MTEPTLGFIASQLERVLIEQRSARDDMRVLTAMVQRHDHTVGAILEELRAIHQWMININERIRKDVG
jgi:hypothetical protein